MKEPAYTSHDSQPLAAQPLGTLVGMLAGCMITLWGVAHDLNVSEILQRGLVGGLMIGVIVRCMTFAWMVFFPQEFQKR